MNDIVAYDNKAMVDIAENYIAQEVKGLALPKNYDYRAAVSSLYLQCVSLRSSDGKPALEVCTPESIKRTIQDMLTKGLNPAKKQCYPIVYAQKDKDTKEVLCYELQLQSSYFGNEKQVYANNPDVIRNSINAQCIYKGDVFEYDIVDGRKVVTKHIQKFENIKNENIVGAYATVKFKDGTTMSDVMTTEEIKRSWAMSRNGTGVHSNFTHEMCCKTVRSRLAKHLNNVTDDEGNLEAELPVQDSEIIYADEIPDANFEETLCGADDFDDTTDVETVEDPPVEKVCTSCGKPLTDRIFNFSMDNFGKPLCINCQKNET